jgi:hypothetical protein
LNDVKEKGGNHHNLVHLNESFIFYDKNDNPNIKNEENIHTCLVFETLGKSLYEYIKGNKYYGFSLH